MLKNWIVKTKQIKNKDKGFLNHVEYLTDQKRPSHHYTKIKVLNDNAANILKAVEERQCDRRSKGIRGGGVSNYCTSFILSLPTDINQPNSREWKKILHEIYKGISDEVGLPASVIREHSFAVLHDESQAPDKCSHVHLLVANVICKSYQKKITQRSVTYAVKQSLNQGVLKTVGECNYAYKPRKKQRYNKPAWTVRLEKAQLIESKINDLRLVYKSIIDSMKKWAANYLSSLPLPSEQYSKETSACLDELNSISPKSELIFESAIETIEKSNISMPKVSMVTPKRKRRKRKRKSVTS